MIELLIVAYIFFAFSFPLHSLALTLGAGTTWIIYRGSFLIKNQPEKGKPILWYSMRASALNFMLSLFLGGAMALLVFFVIFDNYYLFLFNLAFCSIISLRWFDFSHKIFEQQIKKILIESGNPPQFKKESGEFPLFAVCIGLSKKTGIGGGMIPTFIDSGYINEEKSKISFHGVFLRKIFDHHTVLDLEKISSEKIKIFPKIEKAQFNADAYLIILKYQFYPFKSRGPRDRIIEILGHSLISADEGLHPGFVKDNMQVAVTK